VAEAAVLVVREVLEAVVIPELLDLQELPI
jgi:hypothetical protein